MLGLDTSSTVRRALALATINLSTKFEVSISTHYKDMKGDTKYRNGHAHALKVTKKIAQFDRAHMNFYQHSIVTVSLYCTILDTARYWWKIADLNLPHLYLAPLLG